MSSAGSSGSAGVRYLRNDPKPVRSIDPSANQAALLGNFLPCHGSRFGFRAQRRSLGPAVQGLVVAPFSNLVVASLLSW